MDRRQRIIVDPEVPVGKPVVKGARLAVEFIVGLLAVEALRESGHDGWIGHFPVVGPGRVRMTPPPTRDGR